MQYSNYLVVKTCAPSRPLRIWTVWLIAWLCGHIRSWNRLHLGQTSKWILTMTLINNENLLLQLATNQTVLIREMWISIWTKKYGQKESSKKEKNGEENREIASGQASGGQTRLRVYLRVSVDCTYESTSSKGQGHGQLMARLGKSFPIVTYVSHVKWGEGKKGTKTVNCYHPTCWCFKISTHSHV